MERDKPSILLSDNDWKSIRAHLIGLREYSITRTMGRLTITVSTEWTDSKAWPGPMCVRVVASRGDYRCMQNFPSTEEARGGIKQWMV